MRGIFVCGMAVLAFGLLSPVAFAEGDDALQRKVEKLEQEVHQMRSSMLEKDIDTYLDENEAWSGTQGGNGLQGITIHARLTAVNQNTVGSDPSNAHAVGGNVDLDFDFQVTDNLDIFIYLTANTAAPGGSGGSSQFPAQFSARTVPVGLATLSGADDGIGVDGTVPTDPGSITVYEAGIHHALSIGDNKLHWEIGELDSRTRFLQHRYDNEDLYFINNLFDDSPSIPWLKANAGPRATGGTQAGIHMWMSFGGNKQFTLNWGWFNYAGQFFSSGQFMIQFGWKGEVSGREMNVRVMGFIDEVIKDATGDGSSGGGVTWDWAINDKIGVYAMLSTNGGDTQLVEFDASVGVVWEAPMASRPNDRAGLAWGFASVNETAAGPVPEDTEFTLEIFYTFALEEGKALITPHLMFVADPGGGTFANGGAFGDDSLFILGVRIHVPF